MTDEAGDIHVTFPERYRMLDFWLDEAIWGHRLYDQASKYVIFLEMLNVVDSLQRGRKVPFTVGTTEEETAGLTTSFRRSLVLRTILFSNSTLEVPIITELDDAEAWKTQQQALFEACPAPLKKLRGSGPEAFGYLRERFSDYSAYVNLVKILRHGAIEYHSNKRWTSRFLFPYGPEALFEDLNEDTLSTDRRFFGRSGELAYLMLSRSASAREVWKGLRSLLFDAGPHTQRWHKALRSLQPDWEAEREDDRQNGQFIGYLPYDKHHTFDLFGEDFSRVLNAGLPEYDTVPYLATLTAFHLMHYLLVIAAEGLGYSRLAHSHSPVSYILEVRSDRPDAVRRAARYSFQVNNELPRLRLELALKTIRQEPSVARALNDPEPHALKNALGRWWRKAEQTTKKDRTRSPEELWHSFHSSALKRHEQHLGKVHHEYARTCGLVSRAGTTAYRYAPSDDFWRTLVLANVSKDMEYEQFLDTLYDRYGIVIAKRHAEAMRWAGDLADFDNNNRRLQQQLSRLGMMHRLSDACSYVINRYREGGVA